jgi:hypothetical protein
MLNGAEANVSLTIAGSTGAREDRQIVTVGLNGRSYTGVVGGSAWTVAVPAADVQALNHGVTYAVTANLTDAAGNSAAAASRSMSVERTVPVITSVTGPNSGSYRGGSALLVRVSYDEPVFVDTSAGAPAVTLTIGSTPRRASYVGGSGSSVLQFRYFVGSTDTDDDGISITPRIELDGGTIRDAGGNDAPLNFTAPNASGVIVDTTRPSITISKPAATADGTSVRYAITYSDAHFEEATLSLADVTLVRNGTGSGTLALTGSGLQWTVTIANLNGNGRVAIRVAAGTASDAAGNEAPSAGPGAAFVLSAGVGLDGYVAGGTVFFDANGNRHRDNGEPFTTTDDNGRFQLNFSIDEFDRDENGQLDPSEGVLVILGGIDIATGLPLGTPLTALFGSAVVTPLTTLIASALESNPSETPESVQAKVKSGLGINSSADLNQYDPFAAVAAGDPSALQVLNAGARVQDTLVQATALVAAASGRDAMSVSQVVGGALATQIISGSSDLARTETVQAVIQNSATRMGAPLNAGLAQEASQLIAENNAAKNAAAIANVPVAQAVLEISRLQGSAQRQMAGAMAEAAATGVSFEDSIAILGQAEAALTTRSTSVGVVDGGDTRPGQFSFDAASYQMTTIGQPSARITVIRSGGNSGSGKAGLKLGTNAATAPIVIEFANRETSRTVDVLPTINADGELSGLNVINLTLQPVAGGAPNGPTIAPNAAATLVFPSSAPVIATQPAGLDVTAGNPATLTVVATGRPKPRFQWLKGGAPLPGQTNASLVLLNAQPGDAGVYQVSLSNSAGNVTSAAAELKVTSLTLQFLSIQVSGDGSVQLAVRVPSGRPYRIEESGDLRTWTTVEEVTPQGELSNRVFPARSSVTRFFRAVVVD